jgi:linoleoyl-CoA desaturase
MSGESVVASEDAGSASEGAGGVAGVGWASEEARLRSFGAAIDEIRGRIEAKVGAEDVARVRRLDGISRSLEVVGRGLILVSFEPVLFGAGVIALWLHKQLQATEIGHTALHGAYDRLEGAERFQSKTFRWQVPIDEESWRQGHNVRHHQYTNVAGKDPDVHFGPVRNTEHSPHSVASYLGIPITLLLTFPSFGFFMNMHFTGLNDVYGANGPGVHHVLTDRSWKSIGRAHWRTARKYIPYYSKEFVLFPALALLTGASVGKMLLGAWLSEVMRDVYSAATIYCGHIGEHVASYPEGTRAHGRGQWYAMEVEATQNFEVSGPLSILCGGLDRQIEHHLFPKLPPERLREVSAEVRAACEAHGVRYRSAGWGTTLAGAFRHIARLSRKPGGLRALVDEAA